MSAKELAKELGILPQTPTAPEGLTVHELVAQGRYPHQNWFRQWSREDEKIVEEALGKHLAACDRTLRRTRGEFAGARGTA